jgi:nitroreductase
MDLIKSLQWRYATKKFDNKRVIAQRDMATIKEAFNLTASSYGLQPVRLMVVNNKAIQTQLVPFSMNQQQVAQASHLLVFCVETQIDETYIRAYFERVKTIRQTPDQVLDGFRQHILDSFAQSSKEDIRVWAFKQAYLAMGNLLTVCATLGIDACPMEGFEPEKYDTFFDLASKGLQSALIMPIGYRAKDDMFSSLKKVRKSLNESVFEIK